jgi:hypothetical protein
MRSLALVCHAQLVNLESKLYANIFIEDTKSLLAILNGDYVGTMYVKKNGLRGHGGGVNYREAAEKGTIVKGAGPQNMRRQGAQKVAFNIMDVKELLS